MALVEAPCARNAGPTAADATVAWRGPSPAAWRGAFRPDLRICSPSSCAQNRAQFRLRRRVPQVPVVVVLEHCAGDQVRGQKA